MVSSAFSNPDDPIQKEWHEMAKLTGYKPNEQEVKSAATAVAEPKFIRADERLLLDDDDMEEDEETKVPLHQNPIAKLIMAAALVGSGVGALGLFLATVNGQVNQATTTTQAEQGSPQTADQAEDSEIGRLKTINGLGTQAQLLNQANQPSVTRRPNANPASTANAKPAATTARPAPRSIAPAPTPMPLPARSIPAAPSAIPVARSVPLQMAPATAATVGTSTPAVDPMQQWENAKNLGSYGTGATATLAHSIANTTASPPMNIAMPTASVSTASRQSASPMPTIAPLETMTAPSVQIAQSVSTSTDLQYESDVQALMTGIRQSVTEIAPGATAVGTLRTPIAWAEDLDPSQQPQRISIELAQDIPAIDGSSAIPAGSQLIARITAISENGMMQIEAQQAIVQTASGTQTVNLPPGAVLITGQGGNPLVAESRKPGARDSLGDDLEIAAMGALEQVGGLLNRPANESTMTSPYLSSTNVTNGSTSIVGGILEGGFNALMESTQARQQQRQQDIQQRPNLWFVPAGQTVQVFVNTPVQMAIGQGV